MQFQVVVSLIRHKAKSEHQFLQICSNSSIIFCIGLRSQPIYISIRCISGTIGIRESTISEIYISIRTAALSTQLLLTSPPCILYHNYIQVEELRAMLLVAELPL